MSRRVLTLWNSYALLVFFILLLPLSPARAESYSSDQHTNQTPAPNRGLPLLHFNNNSWFEVTIPSKDRPKDAISIEDERTRKSIQDRKDEESNSFNLPDDLNFIDQIELRFRYLY